MKIGVVNTGSSSIKCSLYDSTGMKLLWEDSQSIKDNISSTLKSIWKPIDQLDAIGHRVVHGGERFIKPVLVTSEVKHSITELSQLAPLHNPINLEGIDAMQEIYPKIPQVAVFDTAFHHTLSETHYTYPIPKKWRNLGIRRFGFHGISHQYCSKRAAELLHNPYLKMINCHLGNGCSLAAIANGKSIDTTMGFTPLEGLMMGTRSGSIDPGILIYLMEKQYNSKAIEQGLNFESGLKGITGTEDMHYILNHLESPEMQLGYDLYILSLKKHLLSMMASVSRLDLISFTGGIGENAAKVREDVCQGLAFLGIQLDPDKNASTSSDQIISSDQSTIKVMVIHTQENKSIAEDVYLTI